MISVLATLPIPYRLDEIRALTVARFSQAIDANHVTDGTTEWVAVYLPDPVPPAEVTAWQADVAAHVPTNTPTSTANLNVILEQAETVALPRLTQIINAAPAILAKPQPTFGNVANAQIAVRTLDADFDLVVAAVRDMALYQRQIIRVLVQKLDGTD